MSGYSPGQEYDNDITAMMLPVKWHAWRRKGHWRQLVLMLVILIW
jgi:hypothetical protein